MIFKIWVYSVKYRCYIIGKNCCLNASTVDVFLRNEPQSTSTKNLVHLAQSKLVYISLFKNTSDLKHGRDGYIKDSILAAVRDGVLAKYNYGTPTFNIEHYGVPKPPIYNLSNIPNDFPLFLSYGGQDALSDPKDVATLLDDLKMHDEGKLSVQYIKDYAHADFIMGVTAKDVVYNKIISFFQRNQ